MQLSFHEETLECVQAARVYGCYVNHITYAIGKREREAESYK